MLTFLWAPMLLLLLMLTLSAGAARFSARSRIRVPYSTSRYTFVGPLYTRRLSPSVMGPVYYAYAIRYPMYFNYRRTTAGAGSGEVCTNNLALSNGSYVGSFSCPFLPDEPGNWTSCCGFQNEQFCCDPDYDDSWKLAVGLSVIAIVAIVGACLLAAGVLIFLVICCCVKKRSGGGSGATLSASAAAASKPEVGVSNPVKPPYPTMEYGTVQPPATPYPPPYSGQN